MASDLAPNFQRLSLASSKVIDLGLAQRDLPVLALQQRIALRQLLLLVLQALEQLGNERSGLSGQSRRTHSRKITRAKHALHGARACRCEHRHIHCQRMGR
jgi:hypothetical protein